MRNPPPQVIRADASGLHSEELQLGPWQVAASVGKLPLPETAYSVLEQSPDCKQVPPHVGLESASVNVATVPNPVH